ncbi:MAG: type II toxin-antitoxin system RelE/ParE family toxin [Blastocatellia bacterium]
MKSRLTPEAELDLIEAIRWYDARDQELGDGLLRRVYQCIASVERNPRQYPPVYRQVRRALVHRFPYQILYEVESEEIIIHAIYHSARDPRSGSDALMANARKCFAGQAVELGRRIVQRTRGHCCSTS